MRKPHPKARQVPLREQADQAEQCARHSDPGSLWASANRLVHHVLAAGLRNGYSRHRIAGQLLRAAGPRKPGESIAVNNLRLAARQVTRGLPISLI